MWEPLETLDCSLEEGVELGVKRFVDISVSIASSVGLTGDVGARRPRFGFRVIGRIKRLIQERRRCFREVLRDRRGSSQEREAVELWEESKASTKKECARESWKAFQANLEKGRNLMVLSKQKEFWNWLKSLSGKESWQRHYAKVLADVEGRSQNLEAWVGVSVAEHPELTKINGPIVWKEVKSVLKEIEYHKAAGVDGLPPEWFKAMLGSQRGGQESRNQRKRRKKEKKRLSPMVQAFLKVVNGIWDAGHIPSNLNSTVLVSIPKKGDLTLHDNYRGISLIPVLLKILTSVIIKRIESELEERKFFTKSHADLKKAYDMLPHEALMKKLRAVGVAGKALDFFRNLYSSTSVKVRFEDLVLAPIPVQRAVRQGCPASPSLSNIFINDIMDGFKGLGVEVPRISDVIARLLFVDDLVLFADKAMVVFGDQDRLKLEELLIGEERIGVCESYKYLGLEVDSKLSIERMIKERATTEVIGMHDQSKQQPLQRVVVEGIKWMVGKSAKSSAVGVTILHLTRAVRLGIVDHRIGVRCPLCNKEGGDSLFHVLVKCPRLVHIRNMIEGLESLVLKLWLTSAANDDKSRLVLLLGGEIGGRLCNWLRGCPHWRGTAGFVHVVNLLAEVIPVYDQALREWEVQGDGSHLDLAKGPSGSDTTFEPMPERMRQTSFVSNQLGWVYLTLRRIPRVTGTESESFWPVRILQAMLEHGSLISLGRSFEP
eukprot:Gb_08459 [translate_table: standard]